MEEKDRSVTGVVETAQTTQVGKRGQEELDLIWDKVSRDFPNSSMVRKERKVIIMGRLEILRNRVINAVAVSKTEVEEQKKLMQATIRTDYDKAITRVKDDYVKWLADEGFRMKVESLEKLDQCSRELEKVKDTIESGSANATHKKLMRKIADGIWNDLAKVLFEDYLKNALEEK